MQLDMLVVIARFAEIMEEEGEEAAIKWADEQRLTLEEPSTSDKKPSLRIVGS